LGQAGCDRIASDPENNRDGLGRGFGGKYGRRAVHDSHDSHTPADEIANEG